MRQRTGRHQPMRPGFSMVEVAASTLMVGMVLSGAMAAYAQVLRAQVQMRDLERANHFAEEMVCEILSLRYQDPDYPNAGIGPDAGEATRLNYDDVDDYDAYDETGITDLNGNAYPDGAGLRRSVGVFYGDLTDPGATVGSDLGVKVFTVRVERDGEVLATLYGWRADVDDQLP